jgi:LacI family transcriptional regulator
MADFSSPAGDPADLLRSPGRRPTIRDVAARAGVSVSTVSHALSGKRRVHSATASRVVQAIDELGYRPDPVAQAMVSGHLRTLGLILPDIVNPFFPQVARGAEDIAAEAGFSLILGNTDLRLDRELTYVDALVGRRVGGILFMPGAPEGRRTVDHLRATLVPFVLLDESLDGEDGGGVFSDNVDGGYQAGRHLIDIGRQRLVYLGGPDGLPTVAERESGFRRALVEVGSEPSAARYGPYRIATGVEVVGSLIASGEAFDGLFAGDDLLALGAINALTAAGRRVPEDVAVCGFDGIPGAELWSPSLTTIQQRAYELGASGARLLLDRVAGAISTIPRIVLPVELIARASSGGPSPKRSRS